MSQLAVGVGNTEPWFGRGKVGRANKSKSCLNLLNGFTYFDKEKKKSTDKNCHPNRKNKDGVRRHYHECKKDNNWGYWREDGLAWRGKKPFSLVNFHVWQTKTQHGEKHWRVNGCKKSRLAGFVLKLPFSPRTLAILGKIHPLSLSLVTICWPREPTK